MDRTLQGRAAAITGASHGLGRAVAEHLAELGADVALIARHEEGLEQVVETLRAGGRRALAVPCDVSQPDQVRRAAEQIMAGLGRLDILINNAGIPAPRSIEETNFADWDQVIGVNLSGVFYMTRALWEALAASNAGSVINIAGTSGLRGGPSPAYSSAKFGLTGLTRAIAVAGKPHNLRATVLYPGAMDTGWRGAPIGVKPPDETMAPAEVARFIGYLLSTPGEFVVNEAVLNPIGDPWL